MTERESLTIYGEEVRMWQKPDTEYQSFMIREVRVVLTGNMPPHAQKMALEDFTHRYDNYNGDHSGWGDCIECSYPYHNSMLLRLRKMDSYPGEWKKRDEAYRRSRKE